MTPQDLVDLELIRQLKYRYCRLLDTKRFLEMGELLVDDATVSYGGGAVTLTGRQAVVDFLHRAIGSDRLLTSHLVSHSPRGATTRQ